jgi:ABC-type lipoprotein release transport system permease subunit
VAGAAAASQILAGLLFGISPVDLVSFTIVTVFLLCVAAAASFFAARRGTGVDPMAALRYE